MSQAEKGITPSKRTLLNFFEQGRAQPQNVQLPSTHTTQRDVSTHPSSTHTHAGEETIATAEDITNRILAQYRKVNTYERNGVFHHNDRHYELKAYRKRHQDQINSIPVEVLEDPTLDKYIR